MWAGLLTRRWVLMWHNGKRFRPFNLAFGRHLERLYGMLAGYKNRAVQQLPNV
jgi:hypothetical protein